jgi:hypothetical protein
MYLVSYRTISTQQNRVQSHPNKYCNNRGLSAEASYQRERHVSYHCEIIKENKKAIAQCLRGGGAKREKNKWDN